MYFIPRLLTNRHLRHGFSTIENGNMAFTYGSKEDVIANRRSFLKEARIPSESAVFFEVQHDTKIIEATESLAGSGFYSSAVAIKADAMITKQKNLALVVLTADCIPAIIFDRANEILGVAHISRKNSQVKFAQKLVSYFKKEHGSSLQELKIFFGPAIQKASYVMPEYPKGYDLIGENINQLLLKGVREENIIVDPTDTSTSREFFSHYRAKRTKEEEGRFATVAMLI